MKINWMSNAPWLNSGYGKITALFVPRIASLGHEITISSPYSHSGNVLEWQGHPVLPCARDASGNDTIIPSHEYFSADWTVVLADPFSLLKAAGHLSQIPLAFWFPVDCCPVGDGDIAVLRESRGVPIAMSRFGERMLADEGAEPLYAPLAVDTELYCPGDPYGYRDAVPAISDDTFVIGLVAMNRDPVRKGFAEQLMAFAKFHSRHPRFSPVAAHCPAVQAGTEHQGDDGTPGDLRCGLLSRLVLLRPGDHHRGADGVLVPGAGRPVVLLLRGGLRAAPGRSAGMR